MVSIKSIFKRDIYSNTNLHQETNKGYWIDDLTWHLKQLGKAQEQQQQSKKKNSKNVISLVKGKKS